MKTHLPTRIYINNDFKIQLERRIKLKKKLQNRTQIKALYIIIKLMRETSLGNFTTYSLNITNKPKNHMALKKKNKPCIVEMVNRKVFRKKNQHMIHLFNLIILFHSNVSFIDCKP